MIASVAMTVFIGILLFPIVISRFLFGLPHLRGTTTDAQIVAVSIIGPLMIGAFTFVAYFFSARYSVVIDRESVILLENGEELERRAIKNFLDFKQASLGSRNRMIFRGEPELIIPHMAPWKLRSLDLYIRKTAQSR